MSKFLWRLYGTILLKSILARSSVIFAVSTLILIISWQFGLETNFWITVTVLLSANWLYELRCLAATKAGFNSVAVVYQNERLAYLRERKQLLEVIQRMRLDIPPLKTQHAALVKTAEQQLKRQEYLLKEAETALVAVNVETEKIRAARSKIEAINAKFDLPDILPRKTRGSA